MHPDRRRKGRPRLPVRVPSEMQPAGPPGDSGPGEAQNLGAGGMLLWLKNGMDPGAAVRVTLHLRQRPPLTIEGKVVWVRPHPDLPGWAVGVQFSDELTGEMAADIADEEHPPWTRG